MTAEGYIDTNIFIRFFIADIPEQFQQSKDILQKIEEKQIKGHVSLLVINEIIWIMEHYYNLNRSTYIPQLLKLLLLENIKIIELKKELIIKILQAMMKQKYDFTDMYVTEIAQEKTIYSFDKDIEKIKKNK